MATDLTPQIEQAASEPASATADGQSAQSHPLPDLIEADRYLKGTTAVDGSNGAGGPRTGWGLLRMAKFTPPGAGPGC